MGKKTVITVFLAILATSQAFFEWRAEVDRKKIWEYTAELHRKSGIGPTTLPGWEGK